MGIRVVKTFKEMQMVQKWYFGQVAKALVITAQLIAKVNVDVSKNIIDENLEKYNGGGALISSIQLNKINATEVQVIATDYDNFGRGVPEIEEGLRGLSEVRTVKDYPKLAGWLSSKGIKGKGIKVGNSRGGVPHPKGLHYFQRGAIKSFEEGPSILMEQVSKINV